MVSPPVEEDFNTNAIEQIWGTLSDIAQFDNVVADDANLSQCQNDDDLLNQSIEMRPIDNINYIEKATVQRCQAKICGAEFTMVLRKHHCRACGNVYCGNCCRSKKISSIHMNKKETISQRLCQCCSDKLSADLLAEKKNENRPVSNRVMKIVEEYNRMSLSSRKGRRPLRLLSSCSSSATPLHQRFLGSQVEIASDSDDDAAGLDLTMLVEGEQEAEEDGEADEMREIAGGRELYSTKENTPPMNTQSSPPTMGSLFPSPEFVPANNPARMASLPSSTAAAAAAARKSRGSWQDRDRPQLLLSSPFRVHDEGKDAGSRESEVVLSPRKVRALQPLSANTVSPLCQSRSCPPPDKADSRVALQANNPVHLHIQQQQQPVTGAEVLVHTVTPEQDEDPFDLVEACANLTWDISCCANLPQDSTKVEPLTNQPPTWAASEERGSHPPLTGKVKVKVKTDESRSRLKVRAGRRRRVAESSSSSGWSTPQWLLLVLGLPLLLLLLGLQLHWEQDGDCSLGSCSLLQLPSPPASTTTTPHVQLPPQLSTSPADHSDSVPLMNKGAGGGRSSRVATPSTAYGTLPQSKSYSTQQQCVLVLPEHIVIHMSTSDSPRKSSAGRVGLPLLTHHQQQPSSAHSPTLKTIISSSLHILINRLRDIAFAPGRLCSLLSNWVRHVAQNLKFRV